MLKKQYYKIYEIKSNEEGNADCMTLFSEHLPICKEKKGASAAPSKLFWESVRRRKKFFRSVPSLAPFQSTTEFRSEQNINTTLKQVCVYLIKGLSAPLPTFPVIYHTRWWTYSLR